VEEQCRFEDGVAVVRRDGVVEQLHLVRQRGEMIQHVRLLAVTHCYTLSSVRHAPKGLIGLARQTYLLVDHQVDAFARALQVKPALAQLR